MIPRHLILGAAAMILLALGMSFYAWRMRGSAARPEPAPTQPVAPPVSGPTESVTLYIAYDDGDFLKPQGARIPLPTGRQERARELLRALLNVYLDHNSPHVLPPGSEVRDVYLVDPGLAVIDLNAALADGHRSGVLVEELTVASLIETLTANLPGITRAKILVDGTERDTLAGHVDLTNFYDISSFSQVALQLQNPR